MLGCGGGVVVVAVVGGFTYCLHTQDPSVCKHTMRSGHILIAEGDMIWLHEDVKGERECTETTERERVVEWSLGGSGGRNLGRIVVDCSDQNTRCRRAR